MRYSPFYPPFDISPLLMSSFSPIFRALFINALFSKYESPIMYTIFPRSPSVLRYDATQEVALTVNIMELHQVLKQLLAVFLLPVIVALIQRYDESLVRSIKEFY